MDEKPIAALGIYRVTHFLVVGTIRFLCESDLIVIDGQPYAVLEWEGPRDNQYPALKVELDWAKLHPPSPEGYVVYDGDVIDPRSVQ